MANLFCKSLDFRSFSAVSKPGLFSHGPKKFKANWMRIRRKRALHLTLTCELPQGEVGVISSHEHADGSVSFRFGEVVKGKAILKPDERGKESEDGYAVLKVSDREGDSSIEYVDTAVQEILQLEKSVATLVGSDERVEETHPDSLKFNPENDEANQNLLVVVTDHIKETEIIEAAECTDSTPPSCSEKTEQSSFEEIWGTNIQDEMQNMLDINSPPKEVTESLPLSFEITELEASYSSEVSPSQISLKEEFFLSSGAAMLPHPSKVFTGGEAAYFVAGDTWLGVADGVGLWSLEGTKPGVFAKELIENCERLISHSNAAGAVDSPLKLLISAVSETRSPGSSTCLISRFDGQALHAANVGHSRFIVLRHGSVYKKSSPMYHLFHFPFHIHSGEDPSSAAETYRIYLVEDDVIITATHGFFGNLYDQEISSTVFESLLHDKSLKEIATELALKAQEIGRSAGLRTPLSDEAQAAGFTGFIGGRLDDVVVIVSRVQKRSI